MPEADPVAEAVEGEGHLADLEGLWVVVGEGGLEIVLDQGNLGLEDRNSLGVEDHRVRSQDQGSLQEVGRSLVRTEEDKAEGSHIVVGSLVVGMEILVDLVADPEEGEDLAVLASRSSGIAKRQRWIQESIYGTNCEVLCSIRRKATEISTWFCAFGTGL